MVAGLSAEAIGKKAADGKGGGHCFAASASSDGILVFAVRGRLVLVCGAPVSQLEFLGKGYKCYLVVSTRAPYSP